MGAATNAPTTAPTLAPTAAPTEGPSAAPTLELCSNGARDGNDRAFPLPERARKLILARLPKFLDDEA